MNQQKEYATHWWQFGALLVYAGLTVSAAVFHEPWRDEAQAWLLARDLPLGDLLNHMHYEGSPGLWHLLIYPFAASGLPVYWMHVVHLCIAISIAALILFKAPFSFWFKLSLAFSYFLFWEYAIIARSYSLSILLLFLIAWQYKNRHTTPIRYLALLALLFNTNVHSLFPATALSVLYGYEILSSSKPRSRYLLASSILLIGVALSVWQLIPTPDTNNLDVFHLFSWRAPFIAFANAFFPSIPRTGYLSVGLALVVASIHTWQVYKTSKKSAFILLVSYLGLIYLFMFKHTGSIRHHGFILVLLIFAYWLSPPAWITNRTIPYRHIAALSLLGCLILSSVVVVRNYVLEYQHPFSGAPAAAEFIKASPFANHTLVGHPSIKASALAPYLDNSTIWYADVQEFGTYITWNTQYEEGKSITPVQAIERARQYLSTNEVLFILDRPLPDSLDSLYDLVYQSPATVFGYGEEHYFLYKVRS